MFGTFGSLESFMKVGGEGFVELVKVELCGQIRRLLEAGDLSVVLVPAMAERELRARVARLRAARERVRGPTSAPPPDIQRTCRGSNPPPSLASC
jgi:hypothetical protein